MKTYTILIALILTGFGSLAQYSNTFTGYQSGLNNTTGSSNSFYGYQSGLNNKLGGSNSFFGKYSGYNNIGDNNVFSGYYSGYYNTTGYQNTFTGFFSGLLNTEGRYNTFIGCMTGQNNVLGDENTAIGFLAGPNVSDISNTVTIGAFCRTTASNQVRIGNSSINSIGGQVSWSTLSDGRFKKNLKKNVAGLEFIKELQPVSYEIDMEALDKFLGLDTVSSYTNARTAPVITTGFVAQDVEKLVKEKNYEFHGVEAPENEKDNYAIRYAEFVVPLVKAVQELSAMVESQKDIVEKQQKMIESQQKEISELRSGLTNGTIDHQSGSLNGIQLYQNRPNPFTSSTSIEMYLPQDISHAEVQIIDVDGKILKTVSVSERGNTSITIEEGTLKSGVYIYTLVVDGNIAQSKRLILTE